MVKKFLGVGSFSEDGVTRGLRSNAHGRLLTESRKNIITSDMRGVTIEAGERLTIPVNGEYANLEFSFRAENTFESEVIVNYYIREGSRRNFVGSDTLLPNGARLHGTTVLTNYGNYAELIIRNNSSSQQMILSYFVAANVDESNSDVASSITNKNIITSDMRGVTIEAGERLTIPVNGEYANLEFSFRAENTFESEVIVNYYIREGSRRNFVGSDTLLPSDTRLHGTSVMTNYGNHAELIIRNNSSSQQRILSYFVAANVEESKFKLEQTVSEISEKLDNLKIENGQSIELQNTKEPDSLLKFSQSPLDIDIATIGYDDYFYVIDSDGVLKKYEDIKTESAPVETGTTIDKAIYDNGVRYDGIQRIIVMPEGITIFCTLNETANIYHLDDMNSTPQLVFTSSNGIWWRVFGIDSYHNGIESFIMAGVYGWGHADREVVLSTDGGKSFEIIKLSNNHNSGPNSHWHDVAIDPYHGMLWATEGDGVENRNIYYSHDLGETWVTIPSELQPTTIIPFSNRVVLGRDSNLVGIDVIPMHRTVEELRNLKPQILQEFKDWPAFSHYASSPIQKGTEAYMSFYLYRDSTVPIVVGSGDSGATWHTIFMGVRPNQQQLFAIDDEFIYAYNDQGVVYSKKPNWV